MKLRTALFPKALCLGLALFALVSSTPPGTEERGRDPAAESSASLTEMERAVQESGGISPEEAWYLGRAAAARITARYRPYEKNPALTRYLNSICAAITINSSMPVIYNGYHLMVLDSGEINAFATPGGHIFVTRGLIASASSEDELAAVIAHEAAHIQLGHSIALITNSRIIESLRSIGTQAEAAAGKTELSLFIKAVTEITDAVLDRGYSQSQEFEADALAVSLLASAGYDASSLMAVLSVLERRQAGTGFGKTHPAPALRIARLEALPGARRRSGAASFRLERFRAMRGALEFSGR